MDGWLRTQDVVIAGLILFAAACVLFGVFYQIGRGDRRHQENEEW